MVKSQTILETVKQARSASTKRQFKQSFELVINLKDIDVKKNQINLNETVFLPNPPQNKSKVCVIASGDLSLRAKTDADKVTFEHFCFNKKSRIYCGFFYFINILFKSLKFSCLIAGPIII